MVVFGTRPEAIKLAPIVARLRRSKDFRPIVAVTAQHREMLDQVLDLFSIRPDHDLDIIEARQTLTGLTLRAVAGVSRLVEEERPDAVIVQGDTTTTFAGALAAFYHKVPVVHVEAGLRTGEPYLPFPEELNRRLTAQLAALHLPPTPTARENLLAEGIPRDRIVVTGNTGIDALLWASRHAPRSTDPVIRRLGRDRRRMLLVTAHRRESWGEGMQAIGEALMEIAAARPDLIVVAPLHRNPIVRETLAPLLEPLDNVVLLEPLPYGDFVRLMVRSDVILTDSGGIQEEGPSLGKPVLVMRDVTERPEAVAAGTARLVGTSKRAIVAEVSRLLDDITAYAAMAAAMNPYGDGQAAHRTVAAIAHYFGLGPQPDEFGVEVDIRLTEEKESTPAAWG